MNEQEYPVEYDESLAKVNYKKGYRLSPLCMVRKY